MRQICLKSDTKNDLFLNFAKNFFTTIARMEYSILLTCLLALNFGEIYTLDVIRWSLFSLVVVRSLILLESINKKTPLLEAERKLELVFHNSNNRAWIQRHLQTHNDEKRK